MKGPIAAGVVAFLGVVVWVLVVEAGALRVLVDKLGAFLG